MQVNKIKCELFIQDVPNHQTHKKILLDLIKQLPNNPYENISKTDWNLPKKLKRKYLDYFYPNISKSLMDNLQVYYKSKSWRITNAWFQQYEKNSYHEYHNHTQTNFTNVYFLELPDTNFKTILKIENKEYEYKVKEGQLITFPAHLLHTSKPNGDKRKTIISFNSDFHYDV
tara:strand:- start:4334 stop:4849 length:516 start_codon:yes stop_codon:yes gene_type:complete